MTKEKQIEQIEQEAILKEILDGIQARLTAGTGSSPVVYKCVLCEDEGFICEEDEAGHRLFSKCKCTLAKEAIAKAKKSGLKDLLDAWTFERFMVEDNIQEAMKATALNYSAALSEGKKPWLFMGGQVGSGKSHLCTAICGQAMREGRVVRYFQWMEESRRLKAAVTESHFEELISPWVEAEILYIDDLFKQQRRVNGDLRPTDADVRIAFSLINMRYVRNKPTLITSEWLLTDDLISADEATFSRVYQKCEGFLCEISRDEKKNHRLKSRAF